MRILTKKDEEKMAIILLQMQDLLENKRGHNVNSVYDVMTSGLRDIARIAGTAAYSSYAIGLLERERG